MPTYICTANEGLLTAEHKRAIAQIVTEAHGEITGAPAFFAQVQFQTVPAGDFFLGGVPLAHDHIFVHGHIRGGRSAVDRKELITRIVTEIGSAIGVPPFAIWVYISELPASAMAEFGQILPEPGDEAAWIDKLPADDRARMQAIGSIK